MAATETFAVKRGVARVLLLTIVTNGLYFFYWFYVTRERVTAEVKGTDNVGLQTAGLLVPILNAFILYWLYRDINKARASQKLAPFPAGLYVILPYVLGALALVIMIPSFLSILGGAFSLANDSTDTGGALLGLGLVGVIFGALLAVAGGILHYIFWGIAINRLNLFWDAKSNGKATSAAYGRGEIAIIIVGVILFLLGRFGNYESSQSTNNELNDAVNKATTELDKNTSSQANLNTLFADVQNGMSKQQVRDIAKGGPTSESQTTIGSNSYEYWTYSSGGSVVTITFENGAVSGKSKF